MKEFYNSPMADFVEFDEADVIATSGCTQETDLYNGHDTGNYPNCENRWGYCYLSH